MAPKKCDAPILAHQNENWVQFGLLWKCDLD